MKTIKEAVDVLNGAFVLDPNAIHALVCNKVPVNDGLRDHPTIQVDGASSTLCKVGLLGILNGIFAGDEFIAFSWEDGVPKGFIIVNRTEVIKE